MPETDSQKIQRILEDESSSLEEKIPLLLKEKLTGAAWGVANLLEGEAKPYDEFLKKYVWKSCLPCEGEGW